MTGPTLSIARACRDDLSPREREAIQLAADGHTMQSAGNVMKLSRHYVKHLWWRAAQKLGADNIHHSVAQALRRGLIR